MVGILDSFVSEEPRVKEVERIFYPENTRTIPTVVLYYVFME